MDLKQFSIKWESAFEVRVEIMSANSLQIAQQICKKYNYHPLTLYGLLDYALIIEPNKQIVKDCMTNVLSFIKQPFPNSYFELPTNDPIGEIMLKPIVHFPLVVSQNSNPQLFIEWMLVGFIYLYKSFLNQGLQAYDSLRTMGVAIEQNSDDFAFLLFGHYLGIQDYSGAYTKFIIFCYLSSGLGFQKHGGNNQQFIELTAEAKEYADWLNQRNTFKDIDELFDEGKIIANNLYNKIIKDIENGKIMLENLKVPI